MAVPDTLNQSSASIPGLPLAIEQARAQGLTNRRTEIALEAEEWMSDRDREKRVDDFHNAQIRAKANTRAQLSPEAKAQMGTLGQEMDPKTIADIDTFARTANISFEEALAQLY